ncbi:MAG: hypothetical protein BLM47_05845 [Candidatus Reconcilbacillus cellulovorans]|uniref:4-amino-4-deoxychorismate lyase n=1 Tax=Candidatus Reconcilbacillus cellulovorans TaxID=1906605 RepID=A0A2A6E159_9BACL|nr:MAG: hypothetical protein BLM47_05845 [Candidatus Reconcilbacillus cellulovorans]
MYVWLNGALVGERDAAVSVFDHGLLYGIGLFETFRTHRGRPVFFGRHLRRLAEACRAYGIRYEPDERRLREAAERLLSANGWEDAAVRLSVSAGARPVGLPAGGEYDRPNEWMIGRPLESLREDGAASVRTLVLLKTRRVPPEDAVRRKAFGFANQWLAKRELVRRLAAPACGVDPSSAEGLMLDAGGYIVEGIVSNVFWVSDGRLKTPDLSTGALPGVARSVVLEIAREEGIPCEEGRFPWTDLAAADEVFLTNSVQGVVSVARLVSEDGGEREVPLSGDAASVTSRLRAAYVERALRETEGGGL